MGIRYLKAACFIAASVVACGGGGGGGGGGGSEPAPQIDAPEGSVSGLSSRPSNTSCVAPARPTGDASVATELAFPNLPSATSPIALVQAPGDASQWYLVEQAGRVLTFSSIPGALSFSTFIDIRAGAIDVDCCGERGLLGIAFDPDYGNGNWDVYLSYMIRDPGLTSVIARFTSTDGGLTLDPTTVFELIRLPQPFSNHNGGQITFGPDGYLYIHFGDGGSGGDPGDRAQNLTNLFGAMLRIDVDGGVPYGIPTDNPYASNLDLCDDGFSGSTAECPELYAWGLRNSWRWSFDSATDQLWLGDVGQSAREEINIVELGGNYGWRCREGTRDFNLSGNCPAGLIDPVIEYDHSVGNSVTGGYVYRGTAIPELMGRYVFADYAQGKLFASVDSGDGAYGYETLLDTSHFISSFAVEPDGELLYLDYGAGLIRRIIQAGGSSVDMVSDSLSETGCVMPGAPTLPADGLIPYQPNAPFWSDGLEKERWYAIPDGTSIDVDAEGDWLFPIGTVLMKSFRLDGQLIETRLFMRHTDGEWAGYTYEWNEAETEATRVRGGLVRDVGGQDWIYPSGSECMQCHTQAAKFSLGLEHAQLNGDILYPSTGITANQLVTADSVDLLTDPLPDEPSGLPVLSDPADTGASLEARARAYLHSNCAGCHRPGGPTPSAMDLRYSTPLADTDTCNVVPIGGTLGITDGRLIAPADASRSLLVERAARRDSFGMPPLASTIVDTDGVQLISDWINSLSSCP